MGSGGEVENTGSTITDVTLTTSDGITIAGTYYSSQEENKPGVILLHMLSRSRGDLSDFAEVLQESGYPAIAIDLRGHGESDLNWREFEDSDFNNMVLDVEAAKDFLVEKGKGETNVIIIGGSIGANVALNYAAGDGDIKGIVLLSPGLEYKGVKTEDAMAAYSGRPALIVASEGDTYASQSSQKLYSLAGKKTQIKIYPASAHGTGIILSQNAAPFILDWVQEKT
jgi:alpha-beta hydrolase superfamily lysophospholipase